VGGVAIDPSNGRIVNANLADYLVPVNADIGTIKVSALDKPDFKIELRSYTLDDKGPVVSTFETMLTRLAVSGAVVPFFGCLQGRKLEHDRSFDFRTLQNLVPPISNSKRDRMS